MGILSKWTKKQEKEQLAATESSEQQEQMPAVSQKVEQNDVAVVAGKRHAIIRPIVSEKSLLHEGRGQYTFQVAGNATKIEVKQAVEELYGVRPAKVRMMNMPGKEVRFGRRIGRRSEWKKAVVMLPAGKSIHIHEGV